MVAYNKNNLPVSLSDFVSITVNGRTAQHNYIKDILKDVLDNSDRVVYKLNNDDKIYGKWTVSERSKDGVTLHTKDTMGNSRYVRVVRKK